MFARWPDVDMRAANVAVLEQRERVEYRGGGNAVESGTIPAITQDTGIDASMAVSILRTVDSVLSISVTFKGISPWDGCRGGNGRGTSARKLCGALLSAWTSVERQFTPTRPLKFSKTLQTRAGTRSARLLVCAHVVANILGCHFRIQAVGHLGMRGNDRFAF